MISAPPTATRRLVEATSRLDVLTLRELLASPAGTRARARVGRFDVGLTLIRDAELGYEAIRLHLEPDRKPCEVAITRSACTFGGTRPWWLCKVCAGRARFVYLIRPVPQCARCADLRHESQRRWRDPAYRLGRASRQVQRLQRELFRRGLRTHTRRRLARELREAQARVHKWAIVVEARLPQVSRSV